MSHTMPKQLPSSVWNLGPQKLDWVSPSREFATTEALFDSQPNYQHEVVIALDTKIKYQGIAPVVGGWVFADGRPGPYPPTPDPAGVNDAFTKLFLSFEGIERSTTYNDTNAANWPRKWTQLSGMGGITNVDELFDDGSLRMDGRTVITAPDELRFVFGGGDFTIRGYFKVEFPLGELRVLAAKSNEELTLGFMYWVERDAIGQLSVAIGIDQAFNHRLLTRFEDTIVDRFGNVIVSNFDFVSGGDNRVLHSDTLFSDTLNPGWHSFVFRRLGSIMSLKIDDVEEDTLSIGVEQIMYVPGPFTLGGYGPPKHGYFSGTPWEGGLDRFAIDIGIAR